MKYEVVYISQSGNTEKLAHGIADSLPHRDTFVTDLSCEEITGKADVYLVGFGMKKEAIPLKIMDVLETLEGKTILFFVTASIKPYSAASAADIKLSLSVSCRMISSGFPVFSERIRFRLSLVR